MKDSRLLYDTFNIYYNRGIEALKEKNYELARKNFLSASETLLKLAKESTGELKVKRIARAEELVELASKIEENIKVEGKRSYSKVNFKEKRDDSDDDSLEFASNVTVIENDDKTLDECLEELNSLEGLARVKEQVQDLVNQIKVFKMRKASSLEVPDISYHMVFLGNPGTGKTTVARIMGGIYKSLGILSKGQLCEVSRSDLVAGYMGQTAIKTKEVIQSKALGGVLFIDEAYSLKQRDDDSFGQEAIDTLNKLMEDYRDDLVVIVAGYEENMKTFIDSNPGLKSRFKTFIPFDDYSGDELFNIMINLASSKGYKFNEEAKNYVKAYLNDKNLNNFNGNARDVRNLFEEIVNLQCRRLANIKNASKETLMTFISEDLPFRNQIENIDLNKCLNHKDNNLNNINKTLKDEFKFEWNDLPNVKFDDIAGLDYAKEIVKNKVLLPLKHPEAFDGYLRKNGGGLFLYGPPGTGKTMIAAAIANEIGAKFCSVKPSDLLNTGLGNTEKAIKSLFAQARSYPCSVIYFDEFDALAQKNTRSTQSKQLRSELLAQIQGIESYGKETGNILFLIASSNKPYDVDSAFLRPGRFGTPLYVSLPDEESRRYMITKRFKKIIELGLVEVKDIDINLMVERTNGFNCSDISNLLDHIEEISAIRSINGTNKYIDNLDCLKALDEITSSVQEEDIRKLEEWKEINN